MKINQHPAKSFGGPIEPTIIVLHDTAGSLRKHSSRNYLADNPSNVSIHFVVERDGEVSQLVDTSIKAYHAGRSSYMGRRNCNDFSVGIEIVNPGKLEAYGMNLNKSSSWFGAVFDNEAEGIVRKKTEAHGDGYWMPYTEAQLESVEKLCEIIMKSHDIVDVVTHWMISPGRKTDTNPLFPLDALRSRLFGREEPRSSDREYVLALTHTPSAGLNFRLWPKIVRGNVIRALAHNTAVKVISSEVIEGRGWSRIEFDGSQGYVVTSFLKTLQE